MNDRQLVRLLMQAGFRGDGLRTAFGIAKRESGGRPDAYNPDRSTGDDSYGLFQINMLGDMGPARRRQFGLRSNEDLLDPLTNARAAFRMSKGGRDFGAWGIGPNAYRSGAGYDTIAKHVERMPGGISPEEARASGKHAPMKERVLPKFDVGDILGGGMVSPGIRKSPIEFDPLPGLDIDAPPTAAPLPNMKGAYPVSWFRQKYNPLGAPYQGTHSLGNWQSDNAYDYGVKAGTGVFAPFDLKIGQIKPGASSGRFGGHAMYVTDPRTGKQIYLKHLDSKIPVKTGQTVKAGTRLGSIGNIAGLAPHLHAGYQK